MPTEPWCDFERLEQEIVSQFQCDAYSFHGPAHWRRVERNGIWLSARTGADELVVRLFAWFHDSRRENESTDPGHGRRGAQFAKNLRGQCFDLEDDCFEQLIYACEWHTDQDNSKDTTVGTCWDADRLDLGRVGIIPSPQYMSTAFGKQVAHAGSFFPLLTEAERRAAHS